MKFLLIIFLSFPCFLVAQTTYDKNVQNPYIYTSTDKNVVQDAAIKKLVADTLAKSKRILTLETTIKTMQTSIATMGTQISLLTTKFQDSVISIKKLITTNSVVLSPTDFNIVNGVAYIKK